MNAARPLTMVARDRVSIRPHRRMGCLPSGRTPWGECVERAFPTSERPAAMTIVCPTGSRPGAGLIALKRAARPRPGATLAVLVLAILSIGQAYGDTKEIKDGNYGAISENIDYSYQGPNGEQRGAGSAPSASTAPPPTEHGHGATSTGSRGSMRRVHTTTASSSTTRS